MRQIYKKMIYNFNLKEKATKSLKGKWFDVTLTVFIFSLILAIAGIVYNLLTETLREQAFLLEEQMASIMPFESQENLELYNSLFSKYISVLANLSIYSLITAFGTLIFNAFTMTITSIYMIVANGGEYKIRDLKSRIKSIKDSFLLNVLITLKLIPWFLLFVIPGIIKSFSYALSNYIKIENPEYGYRRAIKESEMIMNGNKRNLFVFYLSFIGWYLLESIAQTFVITMIPTSGFWTILVELLLLAISMPLKVYVGVSTVNFYNVVKNQSRGYAQFTSQANYYQQKNAFSDFNDKKEEPFSNFGVEEKSTKEKDPFSDF